MDIFFVRMRQFLLTLDSIDFLCVVYLHKKSRSFSVLGAVKKSLKIHCPCAFIISIHGFLYYTRTDFMPLADSQKKCPNFIRYSCIQYTAN